jgi:hypothetical protein
MNARASLVGRRDVHDAAPFGDVAVAVSKRYAASPMTEFLGRRPVDAWLSLISNQNG